MSEKIPFTEILARLEPEADPAGYYVESQGEAALISIAISLKRIADAVEGTDRNVGARDALCMIADRMPTN